MRRRSLVGISAVIVLLVVGALLVVQRSRLVPLSPTELALKHINPPSSWADPDCERLRLALKTTVGEPGLKTAISVVPFSEDEIAVYRSVLRQWNSDSRPLNVANRTFPLDALSPDCSCECLRGLDIQYLASASYSTHNLTRDVFPEKHIWFVNADKQLAGVRANDPHNCMAAGKPVERAVNDTFGSGLFSMSEIAFNSDHTEALVSYAFECGSRCGNGGTWLLEKIDGVWKRAERVCGGWVS